MPPRVSVLTASFNHDRTHLVAAYENLISQNVAWEWILQVDGSPDCVPPLASWLPNDPRLSISTNGEQLGTATTRNIGLARCRGDYVQNLDGDDLLIRDALDQLSRALDDHPECVLAFGRDLETHPDGHQDVYQGGLKVGVVPAGVVYERWSHMPFPPIHPAGIMWRKSALFAYGGWTALRNGEDTATLVAATYHHPSIFIDADTLHYRLHEGQFSRDSRFGRWEDVKRAFIHARVESLRAGGPLWRPEHSTAS